VLSLPLSNSGRLLTDLGHVMSVVLIIKLQLVVVTLSSHVRA